MIDQEHSLLLVGHLSCIVFQNKRLAWLQVKAASLAILMHHSLNGEFAVLICLPISWAFDSSPAVNAC